MSPAQSFHDKERERLELARSLHAEGLGREDIAVRMFGRADGITIAAVRDLLREEG